MPDLAVILPAAGSSTRFGGERNKLLEMLGGFPVIRHSILALWNYEFTGGIYIATNNPQVIDLVRSLSSEVVSDIHLCPGGATRAHSVLAALKDVPPRYEWVAVHDAARPLVSPELIDRTFQAAREHGAAAPALSVTLTIKQAQGPLPAPVECTIPRQQLWAMQTPQIMRRADLLAAFAQCPLPLEQVTDDAHLLELAGKPVWLVSGEERNLKITTRADLKLAEIFST